MQAIPVVTPLSRTASLTSSVMSRTERPPAVRSSVWCWKTFTGPIVKLRAAHVTGEPSVARAAAGGGLVGARFPLRLRLPGGGAGAAGGVSDGDCALHALVSVVADRAVHPEGTVSSKGETDG